MFGIADDETIKKLKELFKKIDKLEKYNGVLIITNKKPFKK